MAMYSLYIKSSSTWAITARGVVPAFVADSTLAYILPSAATTRPKLAVEALLIDFTSVSEALMA